MENKFFLQNTIEKIESGRSSFFLDPREREFVVRILKKRGISYQVYIPYEEAEKVLLYSGDFPDIELLEIKSDKSLSHREILGTLFAHQILPNFYSDIMITDTAYVVALKSVATYLKDHIRQIGRIPVEIVRRDILSLDDYHPSYEKQIYRVSSLRLDMMVSKITRKSRKSIEDLIGDKQIFCNYEVVTKKDFFLKSGDIFSIRGYGKYRFHEMIYQTKKGIMDVEIFKYK